MKDREQILAQIKKVKSDSRYNYPIASVFSNAPLALIQVSMTATVQALEWVLSETDHPLKGV